ncbi:response regulator transcription factor [Aureimonas sp. AU4]|uniref:response regulator transcription factor n=1 Tax=Aureimonas sp. AU4 TaxID=1638163 RepID=UPI000785B527|nr:response regulator transcription factor [Aureimonas sp. AU4]
MRGEHKHRIFIVDDHPIVLSGLKALLDGQDDMTVVGQASDAEDLLERLDGLRIDLMVVDGSLPGLSGTELVQRMSATHPSVPVIALTLHEEGAYVREFFKAGARGFVLKRSAATDLLTAIRAVLAGGVYVDPAVASKIVSGEPEVRSRSELLSEREERVARLVAEGYCNKEISSELGLSVKTIETYRSRACDKLGLYSRAALFRHAMSEGWFTAR